MIIMIMMISAIIRNMKIKDKINMIVTALIKMKMSVIVNPIAIVMTPTTIKITKITPNPSILIIQYYRKVLTV